VIEMLIPQACIEELNKFKRIYCWVSGGKDSTAVALALHDQVDQLNGQATFLIHSNTGLTMESSKRTLENLRKTVDFEYIELEPELKGQELKELLIRSFEAIPKARQDVLAGKYHREVFPCCKYLKHNPGRTFIKSIRLARRKKYVFISSIARYEARRRQLFLARIAHEDTFTIWNTRMHAFYCYPLRDIGSREIIPTYLANKGFGDTVSSGCRICPIVILFDMWDLDPQGFVQSKKFMIKQVKGLSYCHQQTLEELMNTH